MSPVKAKNQAAYVRQRLLDYARENDQEFVFVLRNFAMERLLYRLSRSSYSNDFILKGSLLFKLWSGEFYRQTRDIDLLAYISQSIDSLQTVFQEISRISFADDGLTYLPDTVSAEEIREEQQYGGFRITLTAMLGQARIRLQVDCGIGDVVTPAAAYEYFPALLDFPSPRIRTYPRETTVAEKLESIVLLGEANSRMKDFYDLWILASDFQFSGPLLVSAIENTFRHRQTPLPTRTPRAFQSAFVNNPNKQTQWKAFVRKTRFIKVEIDLGKRA